MINNFNKLLVKKNVVRCTEFFLPTGVFGLAWPIAVKENKTSQSSVKVGGIGAWQLHVARGMVFQ